MKTGTLKEIASGDTYSVFDVTDTSFKSNDIDDAFRWVYGALDAYALDDKPIKITDATVATKGGFVTAKYQFV
jgi:hypothetical protein